MSRPRRHPLRETSRGAVTRRRGFPLLLIVAAFILLASASMVYLVSHFSSQRLQTTLGELHDAEMSNELATLHTLLTSYATSRLSQLADYANNPLLLQGVMQPEQIAATLADHLDNLRLFGEAVPLQLLDFTGQPIYATRGTLSARKPDPHLLDLLDSNAPSSQIRMIEHNRVYYWQLAAPVLYAGAAEGLLVAYVRLNQIAELAAIEQRLVDAELQIFRGDQIIFRTGQHSAHAHSKRLAVPELGIELEYCVDNSKSHAAEQVLKTELLTAYIATIPTFLALALGFIQVFLNRPLMAFKDFADKLALHQMPEPLNERLFVRELAHVNQYFNSVAGRAHEDHQALIQLNATLESRIAKRTAQLRAANRELEKLSEIDPLTQLANRRRLDRQLEKEIGRAARTGTSLAVLMLDVDHFKRYNDTYGHAKGDECLVKIANSLDAHAHRPADLVARVGGEEFLVLLPETDTAGCHHVAEQIREAVAGLKIPHTANPGLGHVTISVGGVSVDGRDRKLTMQYLKEEADRQLYRAKSAGRNRVRISEPSVEPARAQSTRPS